MDLRVQSLGLVLLAASLTACATAGIDAAKAPIPGREAVMKTARTELEREPSVVKVKLASNSFIVQEPDRKIPAEIDKHVNADFNNVKLENILYSVARGSGVNLMYQVSRETNLAAATPGQGTVSSPAGFLQTDPVATTKSENKSQTISISYRGRLSGFLKALSRASGYFFAYEDGTVVVREKETFNVPVPAYPELLKEVEANLKSLGASDIGYDRFTSSISFTADSKSIKNVRQFFNNVRNNASLVTMRIILMNVKLTKNENAGIDWSKFVFGYDNQNQHWRNNFGLNQTSTTGTTTGTTTTDLVAPLLDMGAAAVGGSTGINFFFETRDFSMQLLLNFISQYGRFEIMQNVFVESLSGTKGKIDVLTETPYVSEISFSALTSQSTTATQAVKTDKAKSGVEMEVLPYYSRSDGALTIGLKVSVLGVTRFISLEAGQQIGRITQPETTRKNLDTFLRMSPSQVAVIGGLIIEQSGNTASGLPGDNYFSKTTNNTHEKEELVLVLKPTVIEFES